MRHTCPFEKAAPEPKSEIWLEGGHINPGNPDEVKRFIKTMDAWAESQNLHM